MTKFESDVKYVSQPVDALYARYSDLRNLETLREKLEDPAVQEKMAAQLTPEQIAQAKEQLQTMTFDRDTLSIGSPLGKITLRIIERDEPKCIKFAGEGTPIPVNVWIQLLPHGEGEAKLRVTIGAEVNFFMKGMVSKPLQQAANGLADILAAAQEGRSAERPRKFVFNRRLAAARHSPSEFGLCSRLAQTFLKVRLFL